MKVKMEYLDYVTSEQNQVLSKVTIDLSDTISFELEINRDDINNKKCKIKLAEIFGNKELSEDATKDDMRQLIEVFKNAFTQL